MPIYEYRCSACGHKLESLQRFSDAPLVTCPSCGKDALTKQLSAAGFQLKGSGWYATDFKNSGSKPPAKEANKPEAKEANKAEAKDSAAASAPSEAKSDTSSTAKADAPAASSSSSDTKSDQGKSETKSASDKPASTGTTSGGS